MIPSVKVMRLAKEFGPLDLTSPSMHEVWMAISKRFTVRLSQDRVDAITSLAMDLKTNQTAMEVFDRLIVEPTNAEQWHVAAQGFPKFIWTSAGVANLLALKKRRAEQRLFLVVDAKNVGAR